MFEGLTMRSTNLPVLVLVCVLLVGCTAHYPVNEPFSPVVSTGSSASLAEVEGVRSDSLLVGLAFSGGGTRAAAFSYGVLETLSDANVRWDGRERRLVDEVDVISSVSGGSFTAAYYGLFGDRIFEDYLEKFLYRDVEGHLTWSLLSPVSWTKLGSSYYNRSELAADYYDEILFEGKTFGDVLARKGPRLNINATEISVGAQFTFDPAQFNLICSDYRSFPISRAVTASSAVPILFSSVIIRNYAGTCPVEIPPWAQAAVKAADPTSRVYHLVKQMEKFTDSKDMPYIHLYDGGLTDNLGVRPFINRTTLAGGTWNLAKAMGAENVHRMLTIVVNAQSEMDVEFRRTDVDLSLGEAITATTSIPLNEYTFDSLSLMRLALDGMASNLIKGRCEEWARTRESAAGCDDFKVYLVVVDFNELADAKRRNALKSLPTSFVLTVEQVDDLRAAAREIVTNSRDFQEFLRDTGGHLSPPAKK